MPRAGQPGSARRPSPPAGARSCRRRVRGSRSRVPAVLRRCRPTRWSSRREPHPRHPHIPPGPGPLSYASPSTRHAAASERRRRSSALDDTTTRRRRADRGVAHVRPYRPLQSSRTRTSWTQRLARSLCRSGEASAASVVDEVGERARPVAHDAGTAARSRTCSRPGRRADHRMINALLTQAAATAPATSTSSRTRRPARALPRRRHAARGVSRRRALHAAAGLAPEDHGRAGHRREAAAAGRPHPLRSADGAIDLRVSTLPTAHGEGVVHAHARQARDQLAPRASWA